jgi:hypothetical protein
MKYIIAITYLFITSGLFAQEIKYKPVFIDQFTNKVVENYPFSLEKDVNLFFYQNLAYSRCVH